MSMIAMVTPTPHAPFRRDYWDEGRSTDYSSSRPRSDADRVALPSIRQVISDILSFKLSRNSLTTATGLPRAATPDPTTGRRREDAIISHFANWTCNRSDDTARICALAQLKQAEAPVNRR